MGQWPGGLSRSQAHPLLEKNHKWTSGDRKDVFASCRKDVFDTLEEGLEWESLEAGRPAWGEQVSLGKRRWWPQLEEGLGTERGGGIESSVGGRRDTLRDLIWLWKVTDEGVPLEFMENGTIALDGRTGVRNRRYFPRDPHPALCPTCWKHPVNVC